jgi:putative transposase
MARPPRITIAAFPYHVIQRGNNRQTIFFADDDYRHFLECLALAKLKYDCRLYAYVLMSNHFHLLIEPSESGDLSGFMQSVGRRYVRYINDRYGRTGTLWEGRFKSAAVSRDDYLMVCGRYIELNPVRAGLVKHPGEYPWSSYQHRALGNLNQLLDEDPWYSGLGISAEDRQKTYRAWVGAQVAEGEWKQIRQATQQGRLIGREAFQKEMETITGRRLVGESRGRPRKATAARHEKPF